MIVVRANKAKGMHKQAGLPIETPFMRLMYDAMVILVAADDLIPGLTTVYSDDLAAVGKPTQDDGLRGARQFKAFHEKLKRQLAEQSKTASAPSSFGAPPNDVSVERKTIQTECRTWRRRKSSMAPSWKSRLIQTALGRR